VSKEGKPTQKAIAKRIRELRQSQEKIFILPMKEDINTYISEYAIKDIEKDLYFDNEIEHTKGVNILNTTGKNFLKDYNNLYLTCLPKKNADYYKCLAIAFHGDKVANLQTNSNSDNNDWFNDSKLELMYRHDLYSEILQIIHRTALRKINSNEHIHIYIAYDEDKERYNHDGYKVETITDVLNNYYLQKCVSIEYHTVTDESLYGRDKKIEEFAEIIKGKLGNQKYAVITANSVSNSFKKYIHNHWETQQEFIVNELKTYGIEIYIDLDDKRKTKKLKLIN
jgi:hypothetical protein